MTAASIFNTWHQEHYPRKKENEAIQRPPLLVAHLIGDLTFHLQLLMLPCFYLFCLWMHWLWDNLFVNHLFIFNDVNVLSKKKKKVGLLKFLANANVFPTLYSSNWFLLRLQVFNDKKFCWYPSIPFCDIVNRKINI